MQLADLQRVDMGIAMCHFELTARERGLTDRWVVDKQSIEKPDENTEYIASWRAALLSQDEIKPPSVTKA